MKDKKSIEEQVAELTEDQKKKVLKEKIWRIQKKHEKKDNVLHFAEYPSYPYRCFYISIFQNRYAVESVCGVLLSVVNIFDHFFSTINIFLVT